MMCYLEGISLLKFQVLFEEIQVNIILDLVEFNKTYEVQGYVSWDKSEVGCFMKVVNYFFIEFWHSAKIFIG